MTQSDRNENDFLDGYVVSAYLLGLSAIEILETLPNHVVPPDWLIELAHANTSAERARLLASPWSQIRSHLQKPVSWDAETQE